MLRGIASFFVKLMQAWMPDPFLFATILTFLSFALALINSGEPHLGDWAEGVFRIFPFSMQMVLILVTGHALANAPPVFRLIGRIAQVPSSQGQGAVIVLLGAAFGSLLNWGFGLVVGAILAQRVAYRLKSCDYGFLVAAAYSGFIVWESGVSSSIALISATKGSPMNFAEKVYGSAIPLSQTLLVPLNIVPVVLTLASLCLAFLLMQPKVTHHLEVPLEKAEERPDRSTPAAKLEESRPVSFLLGLLVLLALVARGGSMDINGVILAMFGLGLLLHRSPIAYVGAINEAARTVGPLLIQYPLYGGIQGVLEGSGVAALLSDAFVQISSSATLPFWSYCASCILNFFVPSGGGHWVVQGPIVIEAAKTLGASVPATAMGVAFGDQVANMVQPFWALPLLAVAGLSVRDIMGYCVISFSIGFVIFGASLLVF